MPFCSDLLSMPKRGPQSPAAVIEREEKRRRWREQQEQLNKENITNKQNNPDKENNTKYIRDDITTKLVINTTENK